MKGLLFAFALAWAPAAWCLSSGESVVVLFKDGTSSSGTLVSMSEKRVELEVGGARVGWPMGLVDRVETQAAPASDQAPEQQPASPPASAAPEAACPSPHPGPVGLPDAPAPLGFASPGPGACPQQFSSTVVVPVRSASRRRFSKKEQEKFLKELDARREAFKRRPSTPMEDFQFRMQESLDRQAHGLPPYPPDRR